MPQFFSSQRTGFRHDSYSLGHRWLSRQASSGATSSAFTTPKSRTGSRKDQHSDRRRPRPDESSGSDDASAHSRPHGAPSRKRLDKSDIYKAELRVAENRLRREVEASTFSRFLDARAQGFDHNWKQVAAKLLAVDPAKRDEKLVRVVDSALKHKEPWNIYPALRSAFYQVATSHAISPQGLKDQQALVDLSHPAEWFPRTRHLQREVHLHVGPTNSGKTYNALKRLEGATSGLYAGPLRLLAHEVYSRLNNAGKPCELTTGDERRPPTSIPAEPQKGPADVNLVSCTVEMAPVNVPFEVAVVDEIQMIGDPERGWAWTEAFLGLRAKELHLCGETRTVSLIRELCALTGDKLHIHEYKRLSPLEMEPTSLAGDIKGLRKGDCIVCFSVVGIHAMRKRVQEQTRKNVAMVYGSLPPETRAHQARLFNDPDNDYDYLVASDAIGMGLNLSVKRIIFESCTKFDGIKDSVLETAAIKQIAGRAGRFRVAPPPRTNSLDELPPTMTTSPTDTLDKDTTRGGVTTLEKFDYPVIKRAMSSEPPSIKVATLSPPGHILQNFARYFPPGTPYSFILQRLHETANTGPRFAFADMRSRVWIADYLDSVRGLTIPQRSIFTACPAARSDRAMHAQLMPRLARCVVEQSGGNLTDILEIPLEYLTKEVVFTRPFLRNLEMLHKAIICYLWLGYRFQGIFPDRELATHVKSRVEERIATVLDGMKFDEATIQNRRRARERRVQLQELLESSEGPAESETGTAQTAGLSTEKPEDDVTDLYVQGQELGPDESELSSVGDKDPDNNLLTGEGRTVAEQKPALSQPSS